MSIEEYDEKLTIIKKFYTKIECIINKGYNNEIELLDDIVKKINKFNEDNVLLSLSSLSSLSSSNMSLNITDNNEDEENTECEESDEEEKENNNNQTYEDKEKIKIDKFLENTSYPSSYINNNGLILIDRMNTFIKSNYYY
jgi:hypothetical protein